MCLKVAIWITKWLPVFESFLNGLFCEKFERFWSFIGIKEVTNRRSPSIYDGKKGWGTDHHHHHSSRETIGICWQRSCHIMAAFFSIGQVCFLLQKIWSFNFLLLQFLIISNLCTLEKLFSTFAWKWLWRGGLRQLPQWKVHKNKIGQWPHLSLVALLYLVAWYYILYVTHLTKNFIQSDIKTLLMDLLIAFLLHTPIRTHGADKDCGGCWVQYPHGFGDIKNNCFNISIWFPATLLELRIKKESTEIGIVSKWASYFGFYSQLKWV